MKILISFLLLLLVQWTKATEFALYLLNKNTIQQSGAVCLDGSPPGYYFRPGLSTDTDKWRIHFRGGGWCFSPSDCYSRTQTDIGSSTFWPPNIEDTSNAVNGFMSNDTSINPKFANWNTVFVMYCDGSSYTANRDDPLLYNGTNIYFRGKRVLDAILDDLDTRGLNVSKAVVLTGTSAGALTIYIHAEYIRKRLPEAAVVVGMPDAGFFLDHANVNGVYAFRQSFQNAIGPNLWNGSSGVNEACLSTYNADESWHCWMAQYVYPFISNVPIYIVNSLYDTYQTGSILQLGCDPSTAGSCSPAQLDLFQSYRDDFVSTLTEVIDNNRDGLFATACYQHEETCQNYDWDGIKVSGDLMVDGFSDWYYQLNENPADNKLIDVRYPNNPTCTTDKPHGSC